MGNQNENIFLHRDDCSKPIVQFSPVPLPPPFNILNSVHDSSAKGSWIIVLLNSDLNVYVYKCPPQVRIQYSPSYLNHSVMTFIECSNHTYQSVGLLGVMLKKFKSVNADEYLQSNVTLKGEGSLCLCQGVVQNKLGEFFFVVHNMRSTCSSTLFEQLARTTTNALTVCKELFQEKLTIYREKDVSIIYLNQIGGPRHSGWKTTPRLFSENGKLFIESSLQPDSWCNSFINEETHNFNFLTMADIIPRTGGEVKNREYYFKRKDEIFSNLGMNNLFHLSQQPTDVFYCIHHQSIIQDKKQRIQLIELLTDSLYFTFAVPVTENQYQKFESLYKKKSSVSIKEHNSLLLSLVEENGMNVIKLTNLSPQRFQCTDSYMISLISEGSHIPVDKGITRVSETIFKKRLKNNLCGSLDVDYGCVVQYVYSWPYKRVLEKCHVLFLNNCIPRCNSNRKTVKCTTGCYQNLGWRTTSQASGSMVSSPHNTKNHHHYHNGFNKSLLPFLTGMRNNLSTQAMRTGLHIGDPFLQSLVKAKESVAPEEILRGSLVTWGGFSNSVHFDKRDFMSHADSRAVEKLLKHQNNLSCNRLLEQYHNACPGKKLPLSTTCCWCPVLTDGHEEFIHRQFFVNLTCRTSTDISSASFNDKVHQIGSTFFGGVFEHCTMRPLWLNANGYVRITPPDDSPEYWNFAWGRHA